MRNLFKNYRNQDSGMRPLDELILITFFGFSIALVLILITFTSQAQAIKDLREELSVVKLDKKVVAMDEETYKNFIKKYATERLRRNGMK